MEVKNLSGEESLRPMNRMMYEATGYFYETGLNAIMYDYTILHILRFPDYLRGK